MYAEGGAEYTTAVRQKWGRMPRQPLTCPLSEYRLARIVVCRMHRAIPQALEHPRESGVRKTVPTVETSRRQLEYCLM
jgi:hypothetical protein